MLFIDTCYLLSLINKKAKNHERAEEIKVMIKNESTLINSTVLIEMLNNIHKTRYKPLRQELLDVLYTMDNIQYLTPADYNMALQFCKNYDYSVNYSDCTILKTMLDYKINTIVSFDGDFDKVNGINRFY